jgi:hypothetical protein
MRWKLFCFVQTRTAVVRFTVTLNQSPVKCVCWVRMNKVSKRKKQTMGTNCKNPWLSNTVVIYERVKECRKLLYKFKIDFVLKESVASLFIICWWYITDNRSVNFKGDCATLQAYNCPVKLIVFIDRIQFSVEISCLEKVEYLSTFHVQVKVHLLDIY